MFRRGMLFSVLGLMAGVATLLLSQDVLAKDLTSRLGVGIKSNSLDIPALAVVYYPNADFGITGGLGIDTQKDASRLTANGGFRRILFREEHMNFYFGGQAAIVNYETVGNKQSGFELNAVFGAEFFFTGLDSLAFTFEGGAGVTSMKDVRFHTIADHPFKAGIIFYF
ncbi:MAG: organic solvent tolerance protein [Bdellovibrionaceae bacterium]|nr:organic solvent tolerance protein [Pseudobdellovibrionaceae bacterium]MBX3034788.1 organic solvent tolerance protein [Pseudobdellovibrionaceae bacterium]